MSLHSSVDTESCFNYNQSPSFKRTREQNLIWDAMRESGWDNVPAPTHLEGDTVTLGKKNVKHQGFYLSCTPERFMPVSHLGWSIWYYPIVKHVEGKRPVMVRTVNGSDDKASRWQVIDLLKSVMQNKPEPSMEGKTPTQDPIPVKVFNTTPDPAKPFRFNPLD